MWPMPQVKRHETAHLALRPKQDAVPFAPDPYVDYARYLTAEGGVAIIYKGIDERWRLAVRRCGLCSFFTVAAAWLLLSHSPVHNVLVNFVALIITAVINWLIVRQPVQVYRSIEIRPDRMILDGRDVFWLRYMEGWPTFEPGEDETQVLTGIYGKRRVEYLTTRCFDALDSTPTVLEAHLQEAMQQLWSWPY
ncbi:MAG TPA: hypothetical protein VGG11_03335 [Xanthobacteraceae bacterium]|jgi:hypothetical protein